MLFSKSALFMHDPREPHLALLKHTLRYVKGTVSSGLHIGAGPVDTITAYSDADSAGCPNTRRSTSGYCVYLGDTLVSWSSKRQPTVFRSSAEAEYRAVAHAVAECCWLRQLLQELHIPITKATVVYCDNVSAVYMTANPVHHRRTKHIELDIHFVREKVALGQVVRTLAKNPMFARDPRHLQFEADVNRLFLYTSYCRLGENAKEKDAEEIIDLASKASVSDQQKQVQENVHYQLTHMCQTMDSILCPDATSDLSKDPSEAHSRRSGLSFAVGGAASANKQSAAIPATRPLTRTELSSKFRDHFGYTLDTRPSGISHKDAGQGLFLCGKANVGAVLAIYPGVIYSPAYYRYIPGYPRIDACNNYLITRYDGTIIDAKPWCLGGETRELWDGSDLVDYSAMPPKGSENNSDRVWRMLSKPLEKSVRENFGEVLERRNPLAFGHFANHPPKGSSPNVMICPYDFPLIEKNMRVYIPNITFGGEEPIKMKRFGSFYFKSGGSDNQAGDSLVLKTLVLVSTRSISDEELFLNYRYSNSKRRPEWYSSVDEEEDKRRWS